MLWAFVSSEAVAKGIDLVSNEMVACISIVCSRLWRVKANIGQESSRFICDGFIAHAMFESTPSK